MVFGSQQTLADYTHTVYLASREFPEFSKMMLSSEEVEKILKED